MIEQLGDQPPATEVPGERVNPSTGRPGGNSGRSRLWRRTAGAAVVMAVLVVGNATVNSAAANASSRDIGDAAKTSTAGTSMAGTPTAGPAASHDAGASPAALHGEFKVINRDGSAQLRRWQSGAVDAIDEISLTVRSADGFDSTYLLGPGVSVTGIGLGDEVTVVGAGQALPANA